MDSKALLNQLWPDAPVQRAKAELIHERTRQWRETIETTETFFNELATVEQAVGRLYNRLSKTITIPEQEAAGPINHAFKTLLLYSAQKGASHAQFEKILGERTLQQLGKLRSEAIRNSKAVRNDLDKLYGKTQKERDETIAAIATSQKSFLQLEQRSQGKVDSKIVDPWYAEAQISAQVNKMTAQENKFHEGVMAIHERVKVMDSQIVKSIKDVITEFIHYNENHLTLMQESTKQLATLAQGIEINTDFEAYCKKTNLADLNIFKTPVTAKDFKYNVPKSTKPVRAGVLQRQVSLFKIWKNMKVVLTESGFLHVFGENEEAGAVAPTISLHLYGGSVAAVTAQDRHGKTLLEVTSPYGGGLFSSEQKVVLKATSDTEAAEWIQAITRVIKQITPEAPAGANLERSKSRAASRQSVVPPSSSASASASSSSSSTPATAAAAPAAAAEAPAEESSSPSSSSSSATSRPVSQAAPASRNSVVDAPAAPSASTAATAAATAE